MKSFGVMQGRLLPKYKNNYQAHPKDYWQKEFKIAHEMGFDYIEFILDYENYLENPLLNDTGIKEIINIVKKQKVKVLSVCADFFMISPIYIDEYYAKKTNIKVLKKLIKNSSKIGVKDIVIPLVDNSSILNSIEKQKKSIDFLKIFYSDLVKYNVNLSIESDLPPKIFLQFMRDLNHLKLKINYDIGNSAYMGYSFKEELALYNRYISNIHIKDRIFRGGSVQLGTGDADLVQFFKCLDEYNYLGIFIMQAFRSDNAIESITPQIEYVRNIFKNY